MHGEDFHGEEFLTLHRHSVSSALATRTRSSNVAVFLSMNVFTSAH